MNSSQNYRLALHRALNLSNTAFFILLWVSLVIKAANDRRDGQIILNRLGVTRDRVGQTVGHSGKKNTAIYYTLCGQKPAKTMR